jgi:hypothetical protein
MTAPPPDRPAEPDPPVTSESSEQLPGAPAAPPAVAPAGAAGPPPPMPPGPPPPYPFTPVYREPWINPAKRRTAGLAAVAAGLVLLGAGFIAGAAAFDGNGRDHVNRPGQFMRGNDGGVGNGHGRPGIRDGRGRFGPMPGMPGRQLPTPTTVPTTPAPAPTS